MAKPGTGWQAAGRERFRPVVEFMNIRRGDRLLEVGCGNGVAIEMICEALPEASMTAIDRSATMTARALQRNRTYAEAGRARILTAPLAGLEMEQRFDKIFAVNVNVFWMKPVRELAAVKRLLASPGSLFLFFQPPSGGSVAELQEKLRLNLEGSGFAVLRQAELRGKAVMTACTEAALRVPDSP